MPRRIIGIDCGTAIVGWAILESEGSKLKAIAYNQITTPAKLAMPLRLQMIFDQLTDVLEKYKPSEMAVESLFFFKNQTTVMTVSQGRGVIILTGANYGLPVFDYTPLQVKMAVTGYGRAEKKQVQTMVTKIMGLKEIPKPDDVADAIAIAICHLNTRR